LLLIFIFCSQEIHAQDRVSPALLAHFNITVIDGSLFESQLDQDSFLITRDSINAKGRKTKVEIHDRNGILCEYMFIYQDDTVCTQRITRCNGQLLSKTQYYYDDQHREIKAVDFDKTGKPNGTFSTIQYNDKKRTKEVKIYFSNQLSIKEITSYNVDQEPIMISRRRNGKWKHASLKDGMSPDLKKVEIENYNGTSLTLIRKELTIDVEKTILGLGGELKLVPGDLLINEQYRNKDRLIDMEIQFVNQKFIAKKKYKYLSI